MDLKRLIEEAQSGSEHAKTELVKLMRQDRYMRRLSRYLYRNRLLSADDVRGEFWLGVVKAMAVVKHDVGNPLDFLAWKGLHQVKDALRSAISHGVMYECKRCGYKGRYRKRTSEMECGRCGSIDIDSRQIEVILEDRPTVDFRKRLIERMDIAEFKTILTSREAQVLENMLDGFNRDESENYLRDIAERLSVTSQCVVQYLKRIRWKWQVYKKYL